MIFIELEAAINSAGDIQTFYLSDATFTTRPGDTPAGVSFLPLIMDPGPVIEVNVFSDGKTTGATQLSVGEIPLNNANKRFDGWKHYSFEGRRVTIRKGNISGAYPADFETVFTGTVKNVFYDRTRFLIRLVDKQHIFTASLLTAKYDGTNVGAAGVEGTADDIKGQLKPECFGGTIREIEPVPVNTNTLVYQVSNGPIDDIPNVYVRGVELPQGADYANLAALNAAALAAGSYGTCLALGLFRLENEADGMVTADVVQGDTAADRTAGQILKRLALRAGVDPNDIDETAVTDLDAAAPYSVGIFVNDDRAYLDAMDEIARSVGAYFGFTLAGVFTMGVWKAPEGASEATLGEYNTGDTYKLEPAKDNETVIWSITVNYARFYEHRTNDIAGSVLAPRRAALALEYRKAVSEDAALKTQWLLASAMTIDTALTAEADALALGAQVLALQSVPRDMVALPVPVRFATGLRLASCVTVQISRFGYDGGKLMRVCGLRIPLSGSVAQVKVWG